MILPEELRPSRSEMLGSRRAGRDDACNPVFPNPANAATVKMLLDVRKPRKDHLYQEVAPCVARTCVRVHTDPIGGPQLARLTSTSRDAAHPVQPVSWA